MSKSPDHTNTGKRFKKQQMKYLPEWLLLGFSKAKYSAHEVELLLE